MKTLQEEREAIVEEFNKWRSIQTQTGNQITLSMDCLASLKSDVRTALLSHEEKVVAMVREEIRKLVKVKDPTRMHNPELGKINGYNKALTDVMNTLPITDEDNLTKE